MAGESLIYTDAEAFQDYVRQHRMDLFKILLYGFTTAQLATPFDGVKGELVLTESIIQGSLAKRWSKGFNPVPAIKFKPRVLKTTLEKVDISVVPQEYEFSYLGLARRKGQDPKDWPFEGFILMQLLEQLSKEKENAIWHAEEAAVPADSDLLSETFDGYLKIIDDAVGADLTEITTGAIDENNAIASFRTMWKEVGSSYKKAGVDIMCSYDIFDAYRINYKEVFKANPVETSIINESGYSINGLRYELGAGNSNIIPIEGLEGSGRVIMTPRQNLGYGYDAPGDDTFRFKEEIRELRYWMDFRMGCQIMIPRDGIMTINDQA